MNKTIIMKWIAKEKKMPPLGADYTQIILKDHLSVIKIMAYKDGYLMLRRSENIPFVLTPRSLFLTGITHWKFI